MPRISDEEIEDILAEFPEKQVGSVGRDRIVSSIQNVNQISDQLDADVLKSLKNDARERLNRQESQIQHYRDLGFRIARTSIVTIGIIISGVAILVQQEIITSLPNNFVIPVVGIGLMAFSVVAGTFWPLTQGYYYRTQSQQSNYEFFTGVIPEKIEEGTQEQHLLIRILGQQAAMGRIKNSQIERLHISALVAIYSLLVGVGILVGYSLLVLI